MSAANEIQELLVQLGTAREKLTWELRRIDMEYSTLCAQRSKITSGAVSLDEYVAMLKQSFALRGGRQEGFIVAAIKSAGCAYGQLMATMANHPRDGLGGSMWLSLPTLPTIISEEAMYFYFGDIMAERIGRAVAHLPWDEKSMPDELRKTTLAEIDESLSRLQLTRDALAAKLIDAGLRG